MKDKTIKKRKRKNKLKRIRKRKQKGGAFPWLAAAMIAPTALQLTGLT